MSNIVLNGTTYSGSPASLGTPWKPTSISVDIHKIGPAIEMSDGSRHFVQRGTKRVWAIKWDKVNETTRAALVTLGLLSTTFTYVDELGTSYTVQTENDDLKHSTAFTSVTNVYYYGVELTIRQA